jgi:hypothetical protein
MSYGISFRAASKQAALEAIAAQVETILKGQPEHSVGRAPGRIGSAQRS